MLPPRFQCNETPLQRHGRRWTPSLRYPLCCVPLLLCSSLRMLQRLHTGVYGQCTSLLSSLIIFLSLSLSTLRSLRWPPSMPLHSSVPLRDSPSPPVRCFTLALSLPGLSRMEDAQTSSPLSLSTLIILLCPTTTHSRAHWDTPRTIYPRPVPHCSLPVRWSPSVCGCLTEVLLQRDQIRHPHGSIALCMPSMIGWVPRW